MNQEQIERRQEAAWIARNQYRENWKLEVAKGLGPAGLAVSKAIMLANGGSVVAMLTFLGTRDGAVIAAAAQGLVSPLVKFVIGIFFGASVPGLAYLTDAAGLASIHKREESEGLQSDEKIRTLNSAVSLEALSKILFPCSVLAALLGLGLFAWAAVETVQMLPTLVAGKRAS